MYDLVSIDISCNSLYFCNTQSLHINFDAALKIQKQPPQVFSEKVVLKNFTNFIEKHLCWSLFLIKLQAFRPTTVLKKTPMQVLSCEICGIFKNTYFEEYLRTTASKDIETLRKICRNPFSLTCVFQFKDKIEDFVHILKNKGQMKPVFRYILRNNNYLNFSDLLYFLLYLIIVAFVILAEVTTGKININS